MAITTKAGKPGLYLFPVYKVAGQIVQTVIGFLIRLVGKE